jgi:hypothetical protein
MPREMLAFVNRDDLDFGLAEQLPLAQKWDLMECVPRHETAEYQTKMSKFSSVQHLCLFFKSNFGHATTKIAYIGLKGEFIRMNNREPITVNYELAANPADHKQESKLHENVRNVLQ